MANIGKIVEILQREKKTSTVCTAKNMDTSLNNVTARRIIVKNAHTITRRVTRKRKKQQYDKIRIKKRLMSLKRYIMTRYFLEITHSRAKIKQLERKFKNVCCLLNIYLAYGGQPEKMTNLRKNRNVSQDRKQENYNGLFLS